MLSQNSFEHYTKLFNSCMLNFVLSKNIADLEPILTECVGISSLPIKQCLFRKKSKKSFSGFDYQSKQADFVYLLYDNFGNVVYVGASESDKSTRPMQHAKDKTFSLVKCICIFDNKVFGYENIIINALKPKYNKTYKITCT